MQIILPAVLFISIFGLSSCATYRSGQTPDDVYFAEVPVFDPYITLDREHENSDRLREDRQIRMQINNRRFRGLNDPFCYDPSSIMFMNNHCYCMTTGRFMPFIPVNTFIPNHQIRANPTYQPGLASLNNYKNPESVRAGKFISTPRPSNGSRYFGGASNQNQIRYSNENSNTNSENSGSRFFNNSPSTTPSGNFRSSGSSGTGRRH